MIKSVYVPILIRPKLLVLIIFSLFPYFMGADCGKVSAQTPGEWTWMHGDNTPNSPGVFGIQGVSSPANKPPALYEPCEWTDNQGNFWLFGGLFSPSTGAGFLNSSLWKYDPLINEWTWMNGPSAFDQLGVYGIQGTPSLTNHPGARGWGAITWIDASGDLWLFGGSGYDAFGVNADLNDLWKYDIGTNQWAWMKGSNIAVDPGSYGIMGVSAPSNVPPSRSETSCSWTDLFGNLWFYGGIGTFGADGDLWKYEIATNGWTWMQGLGGVNTPPVYGILGVPNSANTPGSRSAYASWTDLNNNLWLFGGSGGGNERNDLWKYNIGLNQWTWVKGPSTAYDPGSYGTKCVPVNTNVPPSKNENRARVKDACGNFWNFGGLSLISCNDLWHYNVSSNQWTWVSGDNISNPIAIYGNRGISSPSNKPVATAGGVAWIDKKGYIWIFGGYITGTANVTNALFRYVPDPACVACNMLNISVVTNGILCNNQCTGSASATPSNGTPPYTYQWDNGETTSAITGLCAGTYSVLVTDAIGSTTTSTVTINQPAAITLTASSTSVTCGSNSGSATISSSGGTPGYAYSWIPSGQVSQTATNLAAGNYTATITDANGCIKTQTVTVTSSMNVTATSTQTGCTINNGTATANPGSGTSPFTYTWNNGQSTQIATGLDGGNYVVTVTDASGCSGQQTINVTQTPGPTASANASANAISLGDSTLLFASGGGNYSWSPITGLSCTNCPNPTAKPEQTTSYCVLVTDTNGCTGSACITIKILCEPLYIPNAFSPNNDLENDLECVFGSCIEKIYFVIYNRWGEKVFSAIGGPASGGESLFCWDGTYKGNPLNTAVFDYYLEATLTSGEKISKKENISLIR